MASSVFAKYTSDKKRFKYATSHYESLACVIEDIGNVLEWTACLLFTIRASNKRIIINISKRREVMRFNNGDRT